MHRTRLKIMFGLAAIIVVAMAGVAFAGGGSSKFKTNLDGYQEDPLVISTPGQGRFEGRVDKNVTEMRYSLSFSDTEGTVTQSHIHIGQPAQSGGIAVFLCSNLGNGPAGTQACPPSGTITGTIRAADVIGPVGQGVTAGQFAEVVGAMRAGAAYVNVHTTLYPGGEIRGGFRDHDHDH